MNGNVFLYTVPQWFVFSALLATIYGWVEEKKAFSIIGLAIFIALSVFSFYTIAGGYLAPGSMPANLSCGEATPEKAILPAYLGFVATGLLAVPGLVLEIKNKKLARVFVVIAGLVSLFGFFVIVGALKST